MNKDDPIWFERDGNRVQAKFLAAGTQDEAKVDPKLGVPRDIAWIEILEGEEEDFVTSAFYREVRPRPG